MLIGTTDHTIDAEYPGAGLVLPTANGNIETLYAPTKDGNRVPRGRRVLSGNGWLCKSRVRQRLLLPGNRSACCDTGRGLEPWRALWTVLPERGQTPRPARSNGIGFPRQSVDLEILAIYMVQQHERLKIWQKSYDLAEGSDAGD